MDKNKNLPSIKPARLGKPFVFEIKLPINVLKQEELTPSEVVIKLIKEMK